MRLWPSRKRKVEITVAEVFHRTPEMPSEKILECLAVDPDTPLLVAILHVLKGIEEIGVENVFVCGIPDSDRTFYAGGISSIAEAQGLIIDLVKQGNDAKRGKKTSDNLPAVLRPALQAGQSGGDTPRSRFVRIGEKPKT